MCGILGIGSRVQEIDVEILQKAGQKQRHRGPDSHDLWVSTCKKVGLHHNRLAIIDTTSAGSQPFISKEYNLVIVFNGEIYNYIELRNELLMLGYSFKTKTDTEVLLIAYVEWGRDFISRLIGMFAFAIYNMSDQTFFFARDRAGEKPLFYMKSENGLIFASELKSIFPFLKTEIKVNLQSLNEYLENGFIGDNRCIIQGLNKLQPGHSMFYDLKTGRQTTTKYWKLELNINSRMEKDIESYLLELENLLEKSIERQLRSDVPLGVLLSGGLDSSIITAIASRKKVNLNTYTIGFPGYNKLDESNYAKSISEAFNTQHTQLNASPNDFINYLPKLAKTFDEPVIDSSMFPTYLVSELVSKHCKVVLGGDGGDELFGGYMHYSRILFLEKKLKPIPQIIKRPLFQLISRIVNPNRSIYRYLKLLPVNFRRDTPRVATYFDLKSRYRLIGQKATNLKLQTKVHNSKGPNIDLLSRLTHLDFKNYLPEDILVKVDRASMANSLEVRAPMLDRDIIEFAFSKVPSELKADHKHRKILLKELGKKILPEDYDYKRKQGFSIPLNDWLRSGIVRDYFWEILTSKSSTFNIDTIKSLFNQLDSGVNNGERLFGLLIFELWRREYNVLIK